MNGLILRTVAVACFAALAFLPISWMATMAFKPAAEWTSAAGGLSFLPKDPTLNNFRYVFTGNSPDQMVGLDRSVWGPLWASLLTSVTGTLIAVICGTAAAYAVSRERINESIGLSLLQLRIFPPLAVMIPVMIMWAFLGMIDTWWGLALIYGIVTLPFSYWLMKAYFDELPREIEEAAIVEGCTPFEAFRQITLPIVASAVSSTALFIFILNWSDYLIALLLTRKDWTTIPVYMNALATAASGQLYGAKAALGLLAAIPPIILGISIQRFLVRGLTFGALKQ
ncbi:carbohydrate ABC transporter permease [Sulfitobacter sp. D35]|uniref:carbohydrate ABC transporter permease n=1 Tax=Sulfitobacter sp. D35 TaxID=3083252 RepID=UPI00296F425A|nr:carbohydrate ABC transporter permease [Sulfitobacter sp. D35]MDW4496589.1 carbohydrate ABC transporter permease [Sulfitobacter sp. D35]